MRDDHSGLLIDRLAASIVDDSLPLKDVEKELRGCVAEVAVKKRGLGKREVASRCGVTEKSIDNYLKEARANPKSPEREIARLLQDGPLSLEEIYEAVRPLLCHGRYFTLDEAKRTLEKLIRTGEAEEVPGKKYRGSERPSIRVPVTVEAYRDLVDEKARDLDYIILTQKEVTETDLPPKKSQQFARVVNDTSLIRIDFTVDVPEEDLPDFYEKLSSEIARLTLNYQKKKGQSRLRLILGLRSVASLFILALTLVLAGGRLPADPGAGGNGAAGNIGRAGKSEDSWELDNRWGHGLGGGGDQNVAQDPDRDKDAPVDPATGSTHDRRNLPAVFIRGDATLDNQIDVSDVMAVLFHLTLNTPLPCLDAADVNDDGKIDFSDPIRLIRFLYADEDLIAGAPGRPAADATTDNLGCSALEG